MEMWKLLKNKNKKAVQQELKNRHKLASCTASVGYLLTFSEHVPAIEKSIVIEFVILTMKKPVI